MVKDRIISSLTKFRELSPTLTARCASLEVNGRLTLTGIYVYETWATEVENTQRMEMAEEMIR